MVAVGPKTMDNDETDVQFTLSIKSIFLKGRL